MITNMQGILLTERVINLKHATRRKLCMKSKSAAAIRVEI